MFEDLALLSGLLSEGDGSSIALSRNSESKIGRV